MKLYQTLLTESSAGLKKFAVLIDPDKYTLGSVEIILNLSKEAGVDYFFLGGKLFYFGIYLL